MASKLNQPTGFIKLTNVAFIKYKVDRLKFEIACYKNKAINWRNGVEKDINEVLQSEEIYENATHGIIAKKDQLSQVFPKMNKDEIIKLILEKGELQVSEKERDAQISNISKDIINFISEKIVHPDSERQFSQEQITQAVQDIHYNIKSDQAPKKQALICLQMLQKKYYIKRANMKISITCRENDEEKIKTLLKDLQINKTQFQKAEVQKQIIAVCVMEPHLYRPLVDGLKTEKIKATTEVLVNNIVNKEVSSINDAQNAELTIREDWEERMMQEENEVQQQKPNKKGKKQQSQQQKQQIQNEEQQQNNDENDFNDGQKIKNKKQRRKQHNRELQKQKEQEQQMKKQQLLENNQGNLDFSEVNMNKLLLEEKKKQQVEQLKEKQKQEEEEKQSQPEKTGKKCTYCKDAVFDPAEFRAHFKSDWHVFNVKRKAQEKSLLSFQEFQIMLLDEQFQK